MLQDSLIKLFNKLFPAKRSERNKKLLEDYENGNILKIEHQNG